MGPIPEPKTSAGIPDSERRQIFYESVELEDRGYDRQKITAVISSKYGISAEALTEIGIEGITRGWPMPRAR